MDFVQQRGNLLDLVNHYQRISLAAKAFPKQRRTGGILAEDVRLQEIYNWSSFAVLSNPIALPDAPRPPKKSRLPRRQPQVQETSGYCAHAGKIIMIIMTRQGSALMWFFTVWSLLQENCVSKKMTTVNVRTNQRSLRL